MSWFRKLNPRAYDKGMALFKKVSVPVQSFFKKGGDGQRILDDVSHYMGHGARVLKDINREANKVIESDIIRHLIGLGNQEDGRKAMAAVRGVNQAIGLAGGLTDIGAGITNRGNYRGSSGDVMTNLLERGKTAYDLGKTGNEIRFE
jgi:hypothetical protein